MSGWRIAKSSFAFGGFIAVLGVSIWMAATHITSAWARTKAEAIIGDSLNGIPEATPDEKAIAIARHIFERLNRMEPRDSLLLRLRPYLTNDRLPSLLRLPRGVIGLMISGGTCDSAARMLIFVLKEAGFEAVQWNMVNGHEAHVAVLVTLPDARKALLDPYFGVATVDQGKRLTHPDIARALVLSGLALKSAFVVVLDESGDRSFYEELDGLRMAAQGETLTIEAPLPIARGPIFLGQIDGDDQDVRAAAEKNHMTPHWHYVGHRYSRFWIRVLAARSPVKVVMTLAEPPDAGVLTATPKPAVVDKTLTWELREGEKITFRDGLASISWRRLNSYIPVDQIALYPLD